MRYMRTAAPPGGGMSGAPSAGDGAGTGALFFGGFFFGAVFGFFAPAFFLTAFFAFFLFATFFLAAFFAAVFFFAFLVDVFFTAFFAMAQPPCECSNANGSAVELNRAATGAKAFGGLRPSSR